MLPVLGNADLREDFQAVAGGGIGRPTRGDPILEAGALLPSGSVRRAPDLAEFSGISREFMAAIFAGLNFGRDPTDNLLRDPRRSRRSPSTLPLRASTADREPEARSGNPKD